MSEESIENVTKSDRNFAPFFADHHFLPDMNFNGHCLIKKQYICSFKRNKSLYFLHTRSAIKKFKHRFYIKAS